jgi:hypothetical protein
MEAEQIKPVNRAFAEPVLAIPPGGARSVNEPISVLQAGASKCEWVFTESRRIRIPFRRVQRAAISCGFLK